MVFYINSALLCSCCLSWTAQQQLHVPLDLYALSNYFGATRSTLGLSLFLLIAYFKLNLQGTQFLVIWPCVAWSPESCRGESFLPSVSLVCKRGQNLTVSLQALYPKASIRHLQDTILRVFIDICLLLLSHLDVFWLTGLRMPEHL